MLIIQDEIFPVFDKTLLEKFLHFNAVKTEIVKEQDEVSYTFEEVSKIVTDALQLDTGLEIQKSSLENFAKSYFVYAPGNTDYNFKAAIRHILNESGLEAVTTEDNVNLEGFCASVIVDENIVIMNYQNSLAIEVMNNSRNLAFEVIDFNILAALKDRLSEKYEYEEPDMIEASITRVYSLNYLTADLSDIIVQLKEKYDTQHKTS